jgi:predicted ester cyclase
MAHERIVERIRMPFDADEYDAIRELWKTHSIAEDARDIDGLMSTLTPDCVYELVQTGHRWEGHEGATRFYLGLLGAFPDIVFDLTDIVIGPQGVFEVADAHGTHTGPWLDVEPSGEHVEFTVMIHFPWDAERKLFTGERVWSYGAESHLPGFPT